MMRIMQSGSRSGVCHACGGDGRVTIAMTPYPVHIVVERQHTVAQHAGLEASRAFVVCATVRDGLCQVK